MRPFTVFLVVWTLFNIALTYRAMPGGRDAGPAAPLPAAGDGRTAVVVPVEARDAILGEMRLMLGAVQGVLAGASDADTAAIRTAAAKAGVVMAADPQLEQLLPGAFLRYGRPTHRAFDSLAAHAADGPDAAIRGLTNITETCVTCHAAYRLELK